MIYVYQALIAITIGIICTAISDTFASGCIAGVLALFINLKISGEVA